MRFFGWHHKRTTGEPMPTWLVDEGKRLLGVLQNRLDLGGPTTNAISRTFADGSKVFAQMAHGMPIVRYVPTGGEVECASCSIPMETGCLELGPNSQATYWRQPIVNSAIPDLYFGDSSRCDEPGAPQGNLMVTSCDDGSSSMSAECQAQNPDGSDKVSQPSTACTATLLVTLLEKKTCQSRLPASIWTGLMQRWVQAMYGVSTASYRAGNWTAEFSTPACLLQIRSTTNTWVDLYYDLTHGTPGIVDLGGLNFRFVIVNATTVEIHTMQLTACAANLRTAIAGMEEGDARDRLLSYVLSQATYVTAIDATLTFTTPVLGKPLAYGWKFDPTSAEFSIVTYRYDTTLHKVFMRLYKRTLAIDDDGNYSITEDDGVEGAYCNFAPGYALATALQIVVPSGNNRAAMSFNMVLKDAFGVGATTVTTDVFDFDVPIYCYYLSDGTLEVINAYLQQNALTGTMSVSPCYTGVSGSGMKELIAASQLGVGSPDCLFRRTIQRQIATAGFYSARYSNVSVTNWGVDGTSLTTNCETHGSRSAKVTGSHTTSGTNHVTYTVSVGDLIGGFDIMIATSGSTTTATGDTTSGGCAFPLRTGGTTDHCQFRCAIVGPVCCPPSGTGVMSSGTFRQDYAYTSTIQELETRDGNFDRNDLHGTLLIVPSASASSYVGVTYPLYSAHISNTGAAYEFTSDTSITPTVTTNTYTCTNGYSGAWVTDHCAGSAHADYFKMNVDVSGGGIGTKDFEAIPPTSIGYGQSHSWSLSTVMIPPGATTSQTVGNLQGDFGTQLLAGITICGYKPDAVITLADIAGSVHTDPTGTYAAFAPPCSTATDDVTSNANTPILSKQMIGSTALSFYNDMFTSVAALVAFVGSNGFSTPNMAMHTSVGGSFAYFADWPTLTPALADQHLIPGAGYPDLIRTSFVGWA